MGTLSSGGEACCGNADAASTDGRLARPQRLNRESYKFPGNSA